MQVFSSLFDLGVSHLWVTHQDEGTIPRFYSKIINMVNVSPTFYYTIFPCMIQSAQEALFPDYLHIVQH